MRWRKTPTHSWSLKLKRSRGFNVLDSAGTLVKLTQRGNYDAFRPPGRVSSPARPRSDVQEVPASAICHPPAHHLNEQSTCIKPKHSAMSAHEGEMTALWYNKPREFEIKQIPIPEIAEDEMLLKVNLCGVCGTDVSLLSYSRKRADGVGTHTRGRIHRQVPAYPRT